jgi:hypothetical protein
MTDLSSTAAKGQRARWFGASQACFVALVLMVLLWIAHLAVGNYGALKQDAAVHNRAKRLLSWMGAAAHRRVAEAVDLSAPCQSEVTWPVCLRALQAAGQPMAGHHNPMQPLGPVFSGKCDRAQPGTLGTIVVEIGLDAVRGVTPVHFVPMPDHERRPGAHLLRLSVCGHGFSVLAVGETWF